jgi:hypothetical protein
LGGKAAAQPYGMVECACGADGYGFFVFFVSLVVHLSLSHWVDNLKIYCNMSPGWSGAGALQPAESRKTTEVMKKSNKNNRDTDGVVALRLPDVARMLPSGCPSAARKLPASCPQVADMLP